jgi:hypothetical protein
MRNVLIDAAPFLLGPVVSMAFTALFILVNFKVQTKEKWEESQREMKAERKYREKMTAENAKLRVALSVGVLTDDGKKVAAMTMAALDAVISTEEAVE